MKKIIITTLLIILFFGCASTNPAIVKTSGSLEEMDESGRTPLSNAVWQTRDIDAVRDLIQRGANVNAKDEEGLTPLELALNIGRMDIVSELIAGGASPYFPENGKGRLFFIGEGFLLRDVWATVEDKYKNLKNGRMDFIDIDPGEHTITIPVSWYETIPTRPVSVQAGQTYYFTLTPTTSRKISVFLGFGLFPAVIADKAGGTGPVAITLIEESVAKEKIKALLGH